MLNWSQITPTLSKLFGQLAFSGVPSVDGFEAQWHDRQRNFTHQETQTDVLLQVVSVRQPVGDDDNVTVTGDDGETYEAIQGDRLVTISCRVESMRQDDEFWAWTTIERIRTRLDRASSTALLRSVNMAFVSTAAATPLPRIRDGRALSVASIDVVFAVGFVDVDTIPLEVIERVELMSRVQDADGTQLPDHQFTVDASS